MKSLNVLVLAPAFKRSAVNADEECLRLIRAVSSRIKVKDGTALATAELRGDSSKKEKLDALLAWAEVIYTLVPLSNLHARAPNVKWIQVISAGVDRWRDTDVWKSHVMITGVSGIHATPVGEFVLAQMLMLAKNAPLSFKMKQTRRWRRYPTSLLRGKTVGIVGLGRIGREVARLSTKFGMKVLATRRSTVIPVTARYVSLVMPGTQLKQMLARSDYVVLSLPLTPDTQHIIGEEELNAMKPTAYLINVGRGQLVDEQALIRTLDKKRIAGAGLDVTYTEPLPKESRLWNFENVILSPHISGGMDDYMLRATEVFCANLQRYLNDEYLLNVVERKRGY